MAVVTIEAAGHRRSNDWFFPRSLHAYFRVTEMALAMANSVSTLESEDLERQVVAEYRNRRRRPITEWSDLADPFEPAGWTDWSPVRSVKLATPGKPRRIEACS